MPTLFLSHCSKDRQFVEKELVPTLESHGIVTWHATRDIRMADNWERRIAGALEKCDWFLVVLTQAALASDWVRTEVHWAMEHRKGRVVPLLLETCDLSTLHLKLLGIQHVDFRYDIDDARARLLSIWGSPTDADRDSDGVTPSSEARLCAPAVQALPRLDIPQPSLSVRVVVGGQNMTVFSVRQVRFPPTMPWPSACSALCAMSGAQQNASEYDVLDLEGNRWLHPRTMEDVATSKIAIVHKECLRYISPDPTVAAMIINAASGPPE